MKGEPTRRECKRCARIVAETPSGHLRAHACSHGRPCVLSYAQRRATPGVKAKCPKCAEARMLRDQLALFPAGST